MRHLIKKILPQTALNKLRQVRSFYALANVKQSSLNNLSRLRPSSEIDTKTLFTDSTIEKKWLEDDKLITSMFPSADLLGGVNPGDRRALYYMIMSLRPKRVLEVGTHIGASTLYIAKALSRSGSDGKAVTVDICNVNDPANGPWKNIGLPHPPKDYLHNIACDDRVQFIANSSVNYLNTTSDNFDLIFLDGDHSAPTVYLEITAALKRLNSGGIIILHDYYPDGLALYPDKSIIYGPYFAASRIQKENPNINFMPLGNLPWPTKQGSNLTSLCLVTKK